MHSEIKTCFFCDGDDMASFRAGSRLYHRCPACGGIALDPSHVLDPESARNRYTLHENSLENAGYRAYLEGFLDAIVAFVGGEGAREPIRSILDWGSGPEPALVRLLSARGFESCGYDPFFAPSVPMPPESADLVTCVEVAEHFLFPRDDFAHAAAYLKRGGFFAVRTGFLPDVADIEAFFVSWWYRQDPTHVSFYSEKALSAAAGSAGLAFSGFAAKDVAIFRKR